MNSTAKSIFAIIGTFLIGLVLGVLITTTFVKHKIKRDHNPKAHVERAKGFFYHATDANAEQKTQIDAILEAKSPEMEKVRETYRNGRRKLMDEVIGEMEAILEAEQIEKMHTKLKQLPEFRKGPPYGTRGPRKQN